MRVISYFTKNTPYENEVDEWLNSFKHCKTAVFSMENQESWEKNCALKCLVIKKALEDYKDNLLFVDIDARCMREFEELPQENLPGLSWWQPPYPGMSEELLSGTIFIPNNDAGKYLVNTWISYQKANPKIWDQYVLQHVVQNKNIPHFRLNHIWIAVNGHIEIENPIIYHHQKSRKYKTLVNLNNQLIQ